ncbi:hypothetical protein AVEN_262082-1 [Araneus ventricosus]|uniref:Uncharacterized protein n=1 Tax=Araneus ventricosus TaxID=182803 RepID=A0A4Y2RID2_ARAVE|nr:hypothetical protein AVEN_241691-1 [Araneus ventricosus]GBN75524.1 hypothetical protein AVEN_262082-1 [Araneus ventricosus]
MEDVLSYISEGLVLLPMKFHFSSTCHYRTGAHCALPFDLPLYDESKINESITHDISRIIRQIMSAATPTTYESSQWVFMLKIKFLIKDNSNTFRSQPRSLEISLTIYYL